MPAIHLSDRHINAIVTWAFNHAYDIPTLLLGQGGQDVAQLLRDANTDGVTTRYPGRPVEMRPIAYQVVPEVLGGLIGPVAIVKACDYLEYNCDAPGWQGSHAQQLLAAIRMSAFNSISKTYREVPEDNDESWEIR